MSKQNNETKVINEYGVDQVDSLEGLDAVRKRPGMYVGSTSQRGVTHLIWEILDNSVDENVAGYGSEILLNVMKGGKVRIEDHGRGMPVGPHAKWKNPDGTPMDALTGLLTKLHAGGKFGNGGYKVSGGLHGVGAKCTNALSETFFVITKKSTGDIWGQKFSKGNPVSDVLNLGSCDPTDTGTIVEYIPDKEIFKQTIEPSDASIQSRLDEITSLNAGLKIIYNNDIANVHKEYFQEDGIKGYARRMIGDKDPLFEEAFYSKGQYILDDNKIIIIEFAFIYDNDDEKPHETFKSFANNINTHEGGTHLTGFRSSYQTAMNNFISKNNLSKDSIELRYLVDGISAIISVKVPEAEFEGQTKSKLGNEEVKDAVQAIVEKAFEGFIKTRKSDLLLIANRAIQVKKAEEAARKARQAARAANKASKIPLPGKLTDCGNKTGHREVIICEGDSAGGSVKQGRFSAFQAVLPLRGKVLNVEKSTFDKMITSDAIKTITSSIGTGIGAHFDIKKIRYDRIVIMTDADDDGCHIRTLLLTLFYRYMKQILIDGYVYAAKPPLYRVTMKNKQYEYIQTDSELKEFKKKYSNKIEVVQRFKGLGEMNYTQLRETVLDPKKRILERITLKDAQEASDTFELLMGKNVERRRDFIEQNAHLVNLAFS